MKRALVFLFIFTLFAWTSLATVIFFLNPTTTNGQTNDSVIMVFVGVVFAALTLLCALIFSLIKAFLPSHKLPHLLIRDSIIQGAVVSFGVSGLLVLQLLRAATVINTLLWLSIIAALGWIVRELLKANHHEQSEQQPTVKFSTRRRR